MALHSLDPATAQVRLAVRGMLAELAPHTSHVLVALSGGADSLALIAAAAFEAPKQGCEVTATIIDHQLQPGSAEVAHQAQVQAQSLGVSAVVVPVQVQNTAEGLEADARRARYAALRNMARERSAGAVLLGHTLDDQAETVLLGLARGSGSASLQGMAPVRQDDSDPTLIWARPMLGLNRETTLAACAAAGFDPWHDPHNRDERFARVRVRHRVLPVLEAELGPGIAQALARTAEQAREDTEAFRIFIEETIEDIVEPAEAGIAVSASALSANPAAIRNRIIRLIVQSEFGVSLSRQQTLEVARLVTHWSGQGAISLPGCTAVRRGGQIFFQAPETRN